MTGFVAVTSLSQCEQRFNKTDGINRDKIQANAKRLPNLILLCNHHKKASA